MFKLKHLINRIPSPLKNKYLITVILFIIWITALDDYNLINQKRIINNIKEMQEQKKFYLTEIEKDSIELYQLQNNPEAQEKFAREKFLMRKKNEDIFIIRENK